MEKKFKCKNCHRYFGSNQALNQHNTTKHQIKIVLLDEMLSPSMDCVRELQRRGMNPIGLPSHLRGQEDAVILNYAYQKGLCLATKDQALARKARKRLTQVYYLE